MDATATRIVHGATVRANVTTYVPITKSMTCLPATISAGLAPLPGVPRFEGVPIVDDMVVVLDSGKDPLLAWDVVRGSAQEYSVELVQLEPGKAPLVLRTLRSQEPSLIIDRTLFVPGLFYYFSISAITHATSAVDGDFTHQAPVAAVGVMPTPAFQVTF